jgi:hypothetical protein
VRSLNPQRPEDYLHADALPKASTEDWTRTRSHVGFDGHPDVLLIRDILARAKRVIRAAQIMPFEADEAARDTRSKVRFSQVSGRSASIVPTAAFGPKPDSHPPASGGRG